METRTLQHMSAITNFHRMCAIRDSIDNSDPAVVGSGSGGDLGRHKGRRGTSEFSYVRKSQAGIETHDFYTGGYTQRDFSGMLSYLEDRYGLPTEGRFLGDQGKEYDPDLDISLADDAPKHYLSQGTATFNTGLGEITLRWNTQKTGTAVLFSNGATLKSFMEVVREDAKAAGIASEQACSR